MTDIELTTEQQEMIERLAGLFYTPQQIAVMIDVTPCTFVTFCKMEESIAYRLYWKGYYEAELAFREQVKKLANLGSSPAQTLLANIINQSKMDRYNH